MSFIKRKAGGREVEKSPDIKANVSEIKIDLDQANKSFYSNFPTQEQHKIEELLTQLDNFKETHHDKIIDFKKKNRNTVDSFEAIEQKIKKSQLNDRHSAIEDVDFSKLCGIIIIYIEQ